MKALARIYAKAFFETVKDSGLSEKWNIFTDQINSFAEVIKKSEEAKIALYGGATSSKEKSDAVEALAKRLKLEVVVSRFLILLAKKGRLGLLPEFAETFDEVRLESEGGLLGQIITADGLDKSEVKALSQLFTKKLKRAVEFKISTDPEMLAGLKVIVNGETYDGTLRSQLSRLREGFIRGSSVIH